jgi:hypothetical protein
MWPFFDTPARVPARKDSDGFVAIRKLIRRLRLSHTGSVTEADEMTATSLERLVLAGARNPWWTVGICRDPVRLGCVTTAAITDTAGVCWPHSADVATVTSAALPSMCRPTSEREKRRCGTWDETVWTRA